MSIKLIVGLANPGAEYMQTRHNAGAWFVTALAKRHGGLLKQEAKFLGYTARLQLAGTEVRLLIPTTFMNLSGKSVVALATFYRILSDEILVVHDDLYLLPGCAKLKWGGSSGGHNGLKDIQNKLGNDSHFYRLRLGIGHPGDTHKVVSFVLSSPLRNERLLIEEAIDEALDCTLLLLEQGIDNAMSRLNGFKAIGGSL